MKTALITGVTGQDGSYLARFLLDKGYRVYGTYRRLSSPNFWRLQYLGVFKKINLVPADLTDSSSLYEAIERSQPDEIYHLAAQSFPGASFEQPVGYGQVTGLGVTKLLEAIKGVNLKTKFYQASTIELFGAGDNRPLTESTAFKPANPYAVAKLYAYWIATVYRDGYGMHICNGIMFSHESPLRGLEFVTRNITNAVARIKLGLDNELKLGNLDSRRDWGFAPDYVKAMWLMLQQDKPEDFIIATNETHTIREFVERAFTVAGLDWNKYVKVDKRLLRASDVNFLQGDYSKAREKLGWEPATRFGNLVEIMVKEDISRWERWRRGELFPWDALNYSG